MVMRGSCTGARVSASAALVVDSMSGILLV